MILPGCSRCTHAMWILRERKQLETLRRAFPRHECGVGATTINPRPSLQKVTFGSLQSRHCRRSWQQGHFCILTVMGVTLEEITDGNRAAVLALRVAPRHDSKPGRTPAAAEPGCDRRHSVIRRTGRSVNVEHGLAIDAAVQQGVDRTLRLAP